MSTLSIVTLIAVFVSVLVALHVYVNRLRVERDKIRQDRINLAKDLLRRYKVNINVEECKECKDVCILYSAQLAIDMEED